MVNLFYTFKHERRWMRHNPKDGVILWTVFRVAWGELNEFKEEIKYIPWKFVPLPYSNLTILALQTATNCECHLWVEPHHLTFDGQEITFQGECEYIISQHTTTQAAETGLRAFNLIGFYHKQKPDDRTSLLNYLKLELENQVFRMHNRMLYVNDVQVSTPYRANGVVISLLPGGTFVSIYLSES